MKIEAEVTPSRRTVHTNVMAYFARLAVAVLEEWQAMNQQIMDSKGTAANPRPTRSAQLKLELMQHLIDAGITAINLISLPLFTPQAVDMGSAQKE